MIEVATTAVLATSVTLAWTIPTGPASPWPGFTVATASSAPVATAPRCLRREWDHQRLRHLHGQDRDVVHHSMLAAGTQCSYAVFAHDSVANHAVAATLAITTAPGVMPQRDSNYRPSDWKAAYSHTILALPAPAAGTCPRSSDG